MDPLDQGSNPAPANLGQSQEVYERALLMWVNERIAEGLNVIQNEPSVKDMDRMIAYIMGDQINGTARPAELMSIPLNRTKDIVLQSVSALTDIHPLFGFKTQNDAFQTQAELLTKLAAAWWVNSFADVQLGNTLRYALINTGYVAVNWDQSQSGGQGDITLTPMDPRDVLPIRPTYGLSVQDWEGLILCETMSVDRCRAKWPHITFEADNYGMFAQRTWKGLLSLIGASPPNPSLGMRDRKAPKGVPTCDIFTIYLKDRHLWQGSQPRELGEPGTNWAYTVYPVGYQKPDGKMATMQDARLFPRGRLIIASRNRIIYDGPNPYWHGMFPVAKLSLDPWPWSLLGSGLVRDLLPLQDALNHVTNGILDMVSKVLRPAVVGDAHAMPDSLWARLDTRLPGLKIKLNSARGKTMEIPEPPQLPDYVFTFWQQLMMEMDTRAGVANLQALTTLAQAPAADSIEQMKEALTPILRMKGRLLEAFLREVGDMVKGNFFQFYTAPRRVAILGDSGLDLADFDFDPGNMIPAMKVGEEGYIPQLDENLSIATRANNHLKNFSFQVTPNSLLAISTLSRKMMYLQLNRMGLMDPWSLAEVMEIPNFGEPPAGADTVVARLQAAMMLGIGGGAQLEEQPGRKPTAQKPPHMEQKDGGQRQTVSES
jgi:hypothetical protein